MVADAAGCENVVSAFRSELSVITGGAVQKPERPFQQLDQVEWETSAEGLRAEHEAMKYWQEQMAVINDLPVTAMFKTDRAALLERWRRS